MRIAFCFNGQIRTGIRCFPSIKNYIGNLYNSVDFFGHTWDINSFRPAFNLNMPEQPPIKISKRDITIFQNCYRFKDVIIEDYDNYKKFLDNNSGTTPLVHIWHSNYLSNIVRQKYENLRGIKYHMVVRLRPDCIFPPDRKLEDDLKELEKNYNSFFYQELFGDVFQFGNSHTMSTVSNFYKEGEFYKNSFWPMHKLISHLSEYKIDVRICEDNRVTILRPGYEYLDPLIYYNHLSAINSFQFESIDYAKRAHIYTFRNLRDPDWYEKGKEIIKELFRNDLNCLRYYFKDENSSLF